MADTIDCTRMSHEACLDVEDGLMDGSSLSTPTEKSKPAQTESSKPTWDRYDCINDCVSSLGAVTFLESSIVALGCFAFPAACPVFIGTAAGAVFGGCDAVCDELER